MSTPSFDSKWMPEPMTGCWLWIGYTDRHGYGRPKQSGKSVLAHRMSWALHFGPIPDGMYICHRCDTPACVNPEHLFLGTGSDNMRDMAAKGRAGKGGRDRRTHCGRGHPLDEKNTYVNPTSGKRSCRACSNSRDRAYFRQYYADNREKLNKDKRRRYAERTSQWRK